MTAASQAASGLIGEVVEEARQEGLVSDDATPDGPADEGNPDVAEAEEEPVAVLEEEPELPADVAALLGDDDETGFSTEWVRNELGVQDDEEEELQPGEYEDPDKLRAQLAKAQKRLQYMEALRAKDNIKAWRSEAEKYFPYADAATLEGKSRKEVLRLAQAQHELAKKGAEKVKAQYEGKVEKLVEARLAEEKAKLEQAWGRPLSGPGQAPAEAAEKADIDTKIANARTLQERILLKIQHKGL